MGNLRKFAAEASAELELVCVAPFPLSLLAVPLAGGSGVHGVAQIQIHHQRKPVFLSLTFPTNNDVFLPGCG